MDRLAEEGLHIVGRRIKKVAYLLVHYGINVLVIAQSYFLTNKICYTKTTFYNIILQLLIYKI